LYRYYRALYERAARHNPMPSPPKSSKIHRSESLANDHGADAAVTIADGPSPIVKISCRS
jgi:hypothetical protein